MAVAVTPVRTPAALAAFAGFSARAYGGDPDFVAPIRSIRALRLWSAGALRPGGRLTLLEARRGTQRVGTIAVCRDVAHDRHRPEDRVAFFGSFELMDDPEVADALLEAAEGTARGWGAGTLRGPRGLTRIDERGALVEGRGLPPFLAGYQPPWIAQFLEARGYEKHHDALAYDVDLDDERGQQKPLPERLARRAAAVSIPGLEVRSARVGNLRADLDLAYQVFVDGFRDVPDNTPMSKRQFVSIGAAYLAVADPRMLQLAAVDGRPAGFALCFPELNEGLAAAHGRLFPGGWLRLARALRGVRTASFKLLGLLPEHRGSGLHALLIRQTITGIRAAGYRRLECSLIDERNGAMRHIVEEAGCAVYRRYRVYERTLDA